MTIKSAETFLLRLAVLCNNHGIFARVCDGVRQYGITGLVAFNGRQAPLFGLFTVRLQGFKIQVALL